MIQDNIVDNKVIDKNEKINLLNKMFGVKTIKEDEEQRVKDRKEKKKEMDEVIIKADDITLNKTDQTILYRNVYEKIIPKLNFVESAKTSTILKKKKIITEWDINNVRKIFINSRINKYDVILDWAAKLGVKNDVITLLNVENYKNEIFTDLNKDLYGYTMYEYVSNVEDAYITNLAENVKIPNLGSGDMTFTLKAPTLREIGEKILYYYLDSNNSIQICAHRGDIKTITFKLLKPAEIIKTKGLIGDTPLDDYLSISEPNFHTTMIYVFNSFVEITSTVNFSITLIDYFNFPQLQIPLFTDIVFSPQQLFLYDLTILKDILTSFSMFEDISTKLKQLIDLYEDVGKKKENLRSVIKYFSSYNKVYNFAKSLKKMIFSGSTKNSFKKLLSTLRTSIFDDKKSEKSKSTEDIIKELKAIYNNFLNRLGNKIIDDFNDNIENYAKKTIEDFADKDNKFKINYDKILSVFYTFLPILKNDKFIDRVTRISTDKYRIFVETKLTRINEDATGENITKKMKDNITSLQETIKSKKKFEVEAITKMLTTKDGEVNVDSILELLKLKRKYKNLETEVKNIVNPKNDGVIKVNLADNDIDLNLNDEIIMSGNSNNNNIVDSSIPAQNQNINSNVLNKIPIIKIKPQKTLKIKIKETDDKKKIKEERLRRAKEARKKKNDALYFDTVQKYIDVLLQDTVYRNKSQSDILEEAKKRATKEMNIFITNENARRYEIYKESNIAKIYDTLADKNPDMSVDDLQKLAEKTYNDLRNEKIQILKIESVQNGQQFDDEDAEEIINEDIGTKENHVVIDEDAELSTLINKVI